MAVEDRPKKNVGLVECMDKQTDGLTDGSVFGGGICIAVVYPHISLVSLFLSLSTALSLSL